jgi:hypothetical protein
MFSILVIHAVIFAMPAKADETLKWRHVQHIASMQAQQVVYVNGHALSIYGLPGIVFFSDGSTGATKVFGMSDTVNGSGLANRYQHVIFLPMVRSCG